MASEFRCHNCSGVFDANDLEIRAVRVHSRLKSAAIGVDQR